MVFDVLPREGQTVQRRVPHRRSRAGGDDGANKRPGGDGLISRLSSEGELLLTLSVDDGEGDVDEGGDAGGIFDGDRDARASTAGAAMLVGGLQTPLPTMRPSSFWHEICLAVRCGMRWGGRGIKTVFTRTCFSRLVQDMTGLQKVRDPLTGFNRPGTQRRYRSDECIRRGLTQDRLSHLIGRARLSDRTLGTWRLSLGFSSPPAP